MGQARLKIYAALGQAAGRTFDVDLPQPRVLIDLLRATATELGFADKLFDQSGRIKPSFTVLLNGTSVNYLDGLNTLVHDGDQVAVLAFVTGG